MGKDAGETQQPADGAGGGTGGSRGDRFCCWCGRGGGAARVIRLQCVAALVLGVTILLSVLFWLPPFTGRGGGKEGPDPSDEFGVTVLLSVLFWLPPFTGRGGGKEGPDPSDEFGGHPVSIRGEKKAWEPTGGAIVLEGIPVSPKAMDKQEHPESSQDPPPELLELLTMKKIPAPSLEVKEEAASTPPAPPPSEELQEPVPLEEEFDPVLPSQSLPEEVINISSLLTHPGDVSD
uniref:Hydroxyproline-rich glycoprotein family protein n=1 Tax=Zea mays TaxID=4577 RepID=A0A804M867_MAIZE